MATQKADESGTRTLPAGTRLLAINFGGLGDEVLFLPTLHSIRQSCPNWHITLLTEPRASGIRLVTDLIDENITFDIKKRPLLPQDLFALLELLRSGGYDAVISSGSSPFVAMLLFLSGIPRRVGYKSNQLARLLLTDPVPLNRAQYAAYMYHDLVTGLNITTSPSAPVILVDPDSINRIATLLDEDAASTGGSLPSAAAPGEDQRQRVLLHPGTSRLALQKGVIKTWPPECWAELVLELLACTTPIDVVLAGGPDDEETIAAITARLNSTAVTGRDRLEDFDGHEIARCADGAGNELTDPPSAAKLKGAVARVECGSGELASGTDALSEDEHTGPLPHPPLNRPDTQAILTGRQQGDARGRFTSIYGKTQDLRDLVAAIQLSDLIICVDSAPMHLSVALRKRVVALFGPTDPRKLVPDDPLYTVLHNPASSSPEVSLRSGRFASGPGVSIPPDTVLRAALSQLKRAADRESSPGCRR